MNYEIYTRLQSLREQIETQVYELEAVRRQMDEAFRGKTADAYSSSINEINRSVLNVCSEIEEWSEKEVRL
ncbi:MAG: hypothetical protein Q4F95_15955 [Oscillospiraceae bacterium]|nr:hypothetical protein [Oscillospiraceae bacterium]